MKLYFKIVISVLLMCGIWGGLLPYLFSEESDIAMFTGLVVLIASFPFAYALMHIIVIEVVHNDEGWK